MQVSGWVFALSSYSTSFAVCSSLNASKFSET